MRAALPQSQTARLGVPQSPHGHRIVRFRDRAPSEPVEAAKPRCRRHPRGPNLVVSQHAVILVLRSDPQRLPVLLFHDREAYRLPFRRFGWIRQYAAGVVVYLRNFSRPMSTCRMIHSRVVAMSSA